MKGCGYVVLICGGCAEDERRVSLILVRCGIVRGGPLMT